MKNVGLSNRFSEEARHAAVLPAGEAQHPVSVPLYDRDLDGISLLK